MRGLHLLGGELRLLWKYGIGLLYVLLTAAYLLLLALLPQSARGITATILVFTDPAAMGLFFMGAILLLEKSQHTNCALAVAPILPGEYILAKAGALLVPGVLVALVLCAFGGCENLALMLLGVAISSILFSLCGMLVALCTNTLNGFMVACVPFEIVLCLPSILYAFEAITSPWWILHPGVAAIRLIQGIAALWPLCAASLLVWTGITFLICRRAVKASFARIGG